MKLLKEILIDQVSEPPNNSYEKRYNRLGKLIYEEYYDDEGCFIQKEFFYDQESKIEKEIFIKSNIFAPSEEKFIKEHQYNKGNYRIIIYKIQERGIDELNLSTASNKEIWKDVDEVIKISEYKYEGNNLLFEKHTDLENNKNFKIAYVYSDYKKTAEVRYDQNMFTYKKEFVYQDSLLTLEREFRKFNKIEYVAFEHHFEYNPKGKIKTIKRFGRYNSKLYLYELIEMRQIKNLLVEKQSLLSWLSFENAMKNSYYYLGQFDNEALRKEFKEDSFIKYLTETTIDELSFDILKKRTIFDQKQNIKEIQNISLVNEKKVVEKEIFHYEYNETGFLEFIIAFEVSPSNCNIQKAYSKRFYYEN